MTPSPHSPRVAVFAHFDPDGDVAPHVRRTIRAIGDSVARLVIVTTASLTPSSRGWLETQGDLIERANTGHDFGSYRAGLEIADAEGSELILLNDSAVFPLVSLSRILGAMGSSPQRFWGITPGYGFAPHVQSSFLVFGRDVVSSPVWRAFWRDIEVSGREEAVLRGEVGLSRALLDAGFSMATLFEPTSVERLVGAARAHAEEWRAVRASGRPRKIAGWARRLPARVTTPEWNPAVALADVALRSPHRLPAVKISALRDDTYRLGAAGLLTALERKYPAEFDGVRAYLERTDASYGGRWARTLLADAGRKGYRY